MSGPKENFRDCIGWEGGGSSFVVERGKIMEFAAAVLDDSAEYRDQAAARKAGFDDVPVPVTFPQSAGLQAPPDRGGSTALRLMAEGYIDRRYLLHGEQEFEYYRPLVPGERLSGKDKLVDAYRKESDNGRTMTFFVLETAYTGEDARPAFASRTILIENFPPRKPS